MNLELKEGEMQTPESQDLPENTSLPQAKIAHPLGHAYFVVT
jgi:hypothetical protein